MMAKMDSRRIVERFIADVGLYCAGLAGRAPHTVASMSELTVHHVIPVVRGSEEGMLMVVCRSCNQIQGCAEACIK